MNNILTAPLTNTYNITLYKAYNKYVEYSISKDHGWVLFHKSRSIETEFSNANLTFHNHNILRFKNITEDTAQSIFNDAGIDGTNKPYIIILPVSDAVFSITANGYGFMLLPLETTNFK